MFKLVAALIAWFFNSNEYVFDFCIPAKARGGYVGVTILLQRPKGATRRPELEQLVEIHRAVQAMVQNMAIETTTYLPPSAIEPVASPYKILSQVVIYPLNDRQLMSLYQEIQNTSKADRRRAVS